MGSEGSSGAANGAGGGVERVLREFSVADSGRRREILDEIAMAAAGGSVKSLELLLRLIDDHRLDRSAIGRILINEEDVEDAHQEVLIAVARSIERYRGDARFTTWLHSVARNCAVDVLRRHKATDRLATDGGSLSIGQRLSSMAASRADLQAAIEQLAEPYRTALVLRDVEQLTYAEVAAALDVELNTVKSRIHRARAMLVRQLGDDVLAGSDG